MATLKTKIMRRVYLLWALRILAQPWLVKSVLLALLFWQLTVFVSIRHVLSNWVSAGGDLGGMYSFVTSAFINTEFATLALLTGIVLVGALLAREFLADHMFRAPAGKFAVRA